VAAIETQQVSKRYGRRSVVQDVTFRVEPGEVYALVGPNGAGKTTVIRLVSGLAFPSSGVVRLLGVDPHEQPAVRRRLGAVVEAPAAFYPYLSGRQNLRLHARLAGRVPESRLGEVLEMMELGYAADRKVRVYSLGMRQRLGVAAAMLTRPEVLILDEPASGMDPLSLHLVHSVLRNAARDGTAVLLSTHHLDEVVAYCSRVAIVEEGQFIDEVSLLERRDRFRVRVSDVQRTQAVLEGQAFIRQAATRGDEVVFTMGDTKALGAVATTLADNGIEVFELAKDTFDLRSYYRERLQEKRLATRRHAETPDPEPPSDEEARS
jgi:ABC-2 type transport system ATP-binding protein